MDQLDAENRFLDWHDYCYTTDQWTLHTKNLTINKKAIHTFFRAYFLGGLSPEPEPEFLRYNSAPSSAPGADHDVHVDCSRPIESGHSAVACEHLDRLKPSWLLEAGPSREALRALHP
jgi:hypothetical protein